MARKKDKIEVEENTESKLNKLIVKPVGPHMYIDITNGDHIPEGRPSVVFRTGFVMEKIGEGHIELITPNIPQEASNLEFQKYLSESDGDEKLAVASFLSQFGLDETGNKIVK